MDDNSFEQGGYLPNESEHLQWLLDSGEVSVDPNAFSLPGTAAHYALPPLNYNLPVVPSQPAIHQPAPVQGQTNQIQFAPMPTQGQRRHEDVIIILHSFTGTHSADERHRRRLLDSILVSNWRLNHILEPNAGEVVYYRQPYTHLAVPDRSVYTFFLERIEGEYQCLLGGWQYCCGERFGRLDRALVHIRRHLDHRPFACLGRCGTTNCSMRFCGQAYLSQHLRNPGTASGSLDANINLQ